MKNKIGMTAAAVLVALSLSACSNTQQSQSSSSATSSNKVKTSQVEKNSSSSSSQAFSKSSQENRMASLTAKLRQIFPDMSLPTKDGLGQGSDNLNVRYTKSDNKNVVYYSVGNSPVQFNDSSLKNEKPYAVLTEVKDADSDTVSDMINYQEKQSGLPTKKLDSSTTATIQGAAGSQYVQWNKGNYSFVIQASSQGNQDPVKKAKEVLSLINQYQLPNTTNKASVQITVGESEGSLNTIIAWQDGNSVYQIKAHDTETALKMLASLK